jgi:hypothetical protein
MLFTGLGLGITYLEIFPPHEKIHDSVQPNEYSFVSSNEPLVKVKGKSSEISTDQNINTFIIVEVLRNYSTERMEEAIMFTYDENVITDKEVSGILTEISDLVDDLGDSEYADIVFEGYDLISLKVKKGEKSYKLDIYFIENSHKIEKMEYSLWK